MNPLSIFNASARATGAKDTGGYNAQESSGQEDNAAQTSFARMLDPSARNDASAAPVQRNDNARRDPVRDKSSRPDRDDAQQDRDDGARRTEDKQRAARTDRNKDETRAAGETDEAETAQQEGEDSATDDSDAGWPPPGLGGFGMMLLGAAPTATAPALPGMPAGAALPALPAGQAAAGAGAPGQGTAATMPGAIALPGLAAANTTAATTTDTAQAMAALAAAAAAQGQAADAGGSDTGAVADVDGSAFVLPTLPQAPVRAHDSTAVFSASPTPTPDLQGDGFDDAVSTRVAWLADQKIGHAHIKVSPDDLGPIEVQLKLDGDKIQANFSSAHADVRQALEQSIPRLREMLGQHGFQLTHSDVGAQQQGQRNDGAAGRMGDTSGADALGGEDTAVIVPASVLRARGLLDAYA